MPDDSNKRDERERSRMAGEQNYEVRHFANSNDISVDQARALIDSCGNDRKMLERLVQQMKV